MPRHSLLSRISFGLVFLVSIGTSAFVGCAQDGTARCDPSAEPCQGSTSDTTTSTSTGPTGSGSTSASATSSTTAGSGQGGSSSTSSGSTTSSTGAGGATGSSGTTGTGGVRDAGGSGGSTGAGGAKDAGSGGSGGAPPLGDASRPFRGKSVVYLPGWRGSFTGWANSIPWSLTTHLVIAFAAPSGNTFTVMGNSHPTIEVLVNAAHANGVRVLVAIGGANGGSEAIAALYTPGNVDTFINNLVSWVDMENLDGVDVDVEGNPVNGDYGPFVDKLVAKLRPSGKLVTAAVGQWYGDRIPASAYAKFDFINLMSYDHCGNWTPACEHASMDWANKDLAFFRNKTSADKIILGVPFYGYCWGTGCPAAAMTYAEIIAKWPGASDFYVNGGITVSYNSRATIVAKTQLSKSYGGIMIWEIGQDANGDPSLMKAIGENL